MFFILCIGEGGRHQISCRKSAFTKKSTTTKNRDAGLFVARQPLNPRFACRAFLGASRQAELESTPHTTRHCHSATCDILKYLKRAAPTTGIPSSFFCWFLVFGGPVAAQLHKTHWVSPSRHSPIPSEPSSELSRSVGHLSISLPAARSSTPSGPRAAVTAAIAGVRSMLDPSSTPNTPPVSYSASLCASGAA
jgi:hypothetical protein